MSYKIEYTFLPTDFTETSRSTYSSLEEARSYATAATSFHGMADLADQILWAEPPETVFESRYLRVSFIQVKEKDE